MYKLFSRIINRGTITAVMISIVLPVFALDRREVGNGIEISTDVISISSSPERSWVFFLTRRKGTASAEEAYFTLQINEKTAGSAIARMANLRGRNNNESVQVEFRLANGETLTTQEGKAKDLRSQDRAGSTTVGSLYISSKFSSFKSTNEPSGLSTDQHARYIANAFRSSNISSITISGITFYPGSNNSASNFWDVMDKHETELGSTIFVYTPPVKKEEHKADPPKDAGPVYTSVAGTQKTITVATSTYLGSIKEQINKWKECRIAGFNSNYGAAVYQDNGYFYMGGIPQGLKDKLKEINTNKNKIHDLNIASNGGYIILFGDTGSSWSSSPEDFSTKMHEFYNDGHHFVSACFNSTDWAIVTNKSFAGSEKARQVMRKASEKYGYIHSVFISPGGNMSVCCEKGIYFEGAPHNLVKKVQSLTYVPKYIKFTDDGIYFLSDGKDKYEYFM